LLGAMSEFRQGRTSGDRVIIAPERGHRPHSWRRPDIAARPAVYTEKSIREDIGEGDRIV